MSEIWNRLSKFHWKFAASVCKFQLLTPFNSLTRDAAGLYGTVIIKTCIYGTKQRCVIIPAADSVNLAARRL